MSSYHFLQSRLLESADRTPAEVARFFKTGQGHYAEGDQFIGVRVPVLRVLSKEFKQLPRSELQLLLTSKINEERLLGLFILVYQYNAGHAQEKEAIYRFYLANLRHVNNWNLVDASAHLIIGVHLYERERDILLTLAQSSQLWERRISVVATWHFIRKDQFDWTLKIAEMLLNDKEDLIHKAVGWMLREVGTRNVSVLIDFLDTHTLNMPRTMLRYAIEKFPEAQRQVYLRRR